MCLNFHDILQEINHFSFLIVVVISFFVFVFLNAVRVLLLCVCVCFVIVSTGKQTLSGPDVCGHLCSCVGFV